MVERQAEAVGLRRNERPLSSMLTRHICFGLKEGKPGCLADLGVGCWLLLSV